MKAAFFLILICLSFFSCKNEKVANQDSAAAVSSDSTKPAASDSAVSKIDVDLTKMNANMIYSYIFEMIIEPESYEGKTIKVSGFYNSFLDEQTGERYFAVIIPDALACCKQGMEFKWTGNHKYPEDYPEENQEITVTGTYRIATLPGDISYSYLESYNLEF